MRYAAAPLAVLLLVFAASFLFYAACLHGPLVPWIRRIGSHAAALVVLVCVTAAINLAVYPRVDALKNLGRGSDEDDAVISVAERLISGQRPLYIPTYLGNTPSPGPGWALLVAPLAATRTYALLTPLAVAVLIWTVGRSGGGEGGRALALLPLTGIGFWELSVTGSDLFAIGVLFTTLTALAWSRDPRHPAAGAIVVAALVGAAASARAPFAWVTANLSLFAWRARRASAWLVAGATAATAAAEVWLWWPDRDRTPFHLLPKFAGLFGTTGVVIAIGAAVVSAGLAFARVNDSLEAGWLALWILLAGPLAVVSIGVLSAVGWQIAAWQAAGYIVVSVPALVAYVAVYTAHREMT